MLDLNHLSLPTTGRTEYFYGKSDVDGESWEIWEKPRGINMIQITCIGGGGGGGGGATNNSTTARAGGSGGSSGGFTTLLIPAIFLPDILYVSAGRGGFGGAAGNPAELGGRGIGSYVSVAPFETIVITTTSATTTATATSTVNHNLTTGDSVVITGATPGQYNGIYTITVTSATTFTYTITSTTPSASSPGTGTIYATKLNQLSNVCYANGGTTSPIQASSTASSGAPSAVAAAVIANMPIAGLGNFSAFAGHIGAAGGLFGNGGGAAITYPTTGLLLSGGAGGGGGSSNGGNASAPTQASYVYFSTLAAGTSGNPATDGRSGYGIEQPLLSIGASGAGAGSTINAAGGNGRPGGFGSGGSGGGAGNPGGSGGNGGPGLVIIQSW